jgi:hypothetical protein
MSMAARTIVTFHPDVACDLCGRRLLRGERPDVFLGGGQRRMVCELCAPRATHEGWRREVEAQLASPRAIAADRDSGAIDERAGELADASSALSSGIDAAGDYTSTDGAADADVRRALEIFNAGEPPRRVAGVTRSLGAACVRATPVAGASTVAIVVAWELCWYRYEVDLEDEAAGVSIAAEGMELEELPAEDRVANAAADEHGMLSLLAS